MFLKLFGLLVVEVGGRDWESGTDECWGPDVTCVASNKGETITSIRKSS